ncbi:MAG: hypothetical protein Q7S57_04335 [bacterium]|nr:hypothetical protein [bacterium]
MFEMIAILGRGIQRLSEDDSWALTEDLEVCDEQSAHLPVRVPVDDDNPLCMVGGGEMNLLAGIELIYRYKPTVVVCAYGSRMSYLESIDASSESEVMSRELAIKILPRLNFWASGTAYMPVVIAWERHRKLSASNTCQELLNVFDLALEHGFRRIGFVTVGVHIARTGTYVAKHLSVYEKYRVLSPVVFESEEVLLTTDREKYGPRVEVLRNSKSFARNWEREAAGISKIIRGVYSDVKPVIAS